MPRPPSEKTIRRQPPSLSFGPYDLEPPGLVRLSLEGWEALRLVEVEGLDQEAAAELMDVSRPTFGRVLASARQAVATALVGGLGLEIGGGAYRLHPEAGPAGMGRGRGRGRGQGQGHGRRRARR